jgi:hypothetical protein
MDMNMYKDRDTNMYKDRDQNMYTDRDDTNMYKHEHVRYTDGYEHVQDRDTNMCKDRDSHEHEQGQRPEHVQAHEHVEGQACKRAGTCAWTETRICTSTRT